MTLNITLDGKTYEVEVEAHEPEEFAWTGGGNGAGYVPPQLRVPAASDAHALPPPVVSPAAPSGAAESKCCRSPIAGMVVKVSAKPGQQIEPGDILLVLEAMKMETNITAPVAGKVVKVLAAAGDSVQGGQVLVEFE